MWLMYLSVIIVEAKLEGVGAILYLYGPSLCFGNGSPVNFLPTWKGLRQRDLLSPFTIHFDVETLS